MNALIDYEGARTIVNNTKRLVENAIAAHISNANSNTSVTGLKIAIGDNQAVNKSVWLDTSDYASVNGAIATYSPSANSDNIEFVVSDTEPTDTNVAWINTSGYST